MDDIVQKMRIAGLIDSITSLFQETHADQLEAYVAMEMMILIGRETNPTLTSSAKALADSIWAEAQKLL